MIFKDFRLFDLLTILIGLKNITINIDREPFFIHFAREKIDLRIF